MLVNMIQGDSLVGHTLGVDRVHRGGSVKPIFNGFVIFITKIQGDLSISPHYLISRILRTNL